MIDLDTVAGSLHSALLYLEAVRSAIPAGQTVSKLPYFEQTARLGRKECAIRRTSFGYMSR